MMEILIRLKYVRKINSEAGEMDGSAVKSTGSLFQGTQVRVPAPTWQFSVIPVPDLPSSPGLHEYQVHTATEEHSGTTPTYKK